MPERDLTEVIDARGDVAQREFARDDAEIDVGAVEAQQHVFSSLTSFLL